jgi:hypothetical protein
MLASAMASGRKPSKLTINTRLKFGAGVPVGAGVSVAGGGGELLGLAVAVGAKTVVGGRGAANKPQDSMKNVRNVKFTRRLVIFGLFRAWF